MAAGYRLRADPKLSRGARVLFSLLVAGCHADPPELPTIDGSEALPNHAPNSGNVIPSANSPGAAPGAARGPTPTAVPESGTPPPDAAGEPKTAPTQTSATAPPDAEPETTMVPIYGATVVEVFDVLAFGANSTEILEQWEPTFEALADLFTRYPKMRLRLFGHTDPATEARHAAVLSEQRALAVRHALIERGAPAGRIEVFRCGDTQPHPTKTNGRVEFQVQGEVDGAVLAEKSPAEGCERFTPGPARSKSKATSESN